MPSKIKCSFWPPAATAALPMTAGATVARASLGTATTWTLKIYKGVPHGMCTTLKQQVNEDLLAFIKT
jgi:hypothetical protein